MSKVDQSSWITLSITLTPDDFMDLQDAVAELHWSAGRTSAFLDHIVEQYKLKLEESKPSTYAQKDFDFLKEMVSLGKTSEGQRIMTTSSYFMNRIVDLHDQYGREKINKTIDLLKKHEADHECAKTNQA
jgi:hypothetical protein